MQYQGRAHRVGAHIDTDAIIPARCLISTDPQELGKSCMAGLDPDWVQGINPGDILVAGPNFGCGSSREHAPLAILGAGIPVVVAHSFARIFYRNGFNMGLVLLEIADQVQNISQGDVLHIDVEQGHIFNQSTREQIQVQPLPEFMQNILRQGGLVEYVRAQMAQG
ncbi:MAG: 3-isopropylmalate dehydratase small subunit [Desulfohalobiaceae bacterium]